MIKQKTAIKLSNKIKQYFSVDTEGYMRANKKAQMKSLPSVSKTYGPQNDLFNDFNMSPEKMSFRIEMLSSEEWFQYVNIVSSHINSKNTQGRELRLGVLETNTNKWVGFIRVNSPLINMKPRNDLVENKKPNLKRVNRHILNGNTIVPVQPFGYNCLGGKLLALICTSDWLRRKFDRKHKTNIVMFETTSLYGNSKSCSQYDGLKPFIRNKGLTESNFVPLIQGNLFKELKDTIKPEIKTKSSNRKLLTQKSCFQEIKKSLPKDKRISFLRTLEKAKSINEQKRYYVSNYGFSNYVDVINEQPEVFKRQLDKNENYDKHNLQNLIEFWRNKAVKRYQKVKSNNKLRTEQETWLDDEDLQIIR